MALPLPRTVADVGPGGPLVTALQGMNALQMAMLKNKMQKLQNQYYEPNIQSEIEQRNALTQGQNIKNQYLPDELRLANALAEIKNQYLPKELRQRAAQREFGLQNPLLNMPGAAGQIGALNYIKSHPQLFGDQSTSNPMAQDFSNLLEQSIKNEFRQKGNAPTKEFKNAQAYQDASEGFVPFTNRTQLIKSEDEKLRYMEATKPSQKDKDIAKHQEQSLARKHWDSLTPETKAHLVAIGQGAGMRGDQVEKAMSSGRNFDDILYERGYDPENPPEPIYELSKGNIKALNEREYSSREVKYLSDFINKATGDYANKVKGYNVSQVKDALFNRNKEQQARFLAARMLAPELINLRLTLGGARATVHAIKSMTDKAMLNSRIFEPLVSNEVWHRTQEIADQELQKAFLASKKGYGEPAKSKNTNPKIDYSKYDVPEGYVGLYKNGKAYFFPPELVNKKLSQGYTYE